MKNNAEAKAVLHAMLARLDSDPRSAEEWRAIAAYARSVAAYATKCAQLHATLRTYRVFHDGVGEPDTVTLHGLFAVNEFNEFDKAALRSLDVGQACAFGGGAAPEVIVRRVS